MIIRAKQGFHIRVYASEFQFRIGAVKFFQLCEDFGGSHAARQQDCCAHQDWFDRGLEQGARALITAGP